MREVEDLQSIRGVPFPAGVSFRQLVITGPPGAGKTTLVSAIGGWPEEGFLDLTRPNWWRARVLALRPRQLHLGFPFVGFSRGLSVFEREWMDHPEPPTLDLDRIQLPPLGGRRDPWKWRRKYVFEFLVPPAAKVFDARLRRSDRQSHLIDDDLTLDRVEAQLTATWRVARHLHHAGMTVYVRDDFGGPPKVFAEPSSVEVVESHMRGGRRGPRRSLLQSYIKRIISPSGYRVLDRFEQVQLRGRRILVPHRILPIELVLGTQRLQVYPDGDQDVRVLDPDRYFSEPASFARIVPDGQLRLPTDTLLTPGLPSDIPARVEIANEGDLITVVDLDSPTGTSLRALTPAEAAPLDVDRRERLKRLRTIFEGMPPFLPPDVAAREMDQAIAILEQGHFQPRDSRGLPGGLVELPDDIRPIILGDLHAQVDNLVHVLSEGRFLDALAEGSAALILLGDVVHPEEGDLSDMGPSLLITDMVVRLMLAFPGRIIHLRGNHETFSADIQKDGVAQGRLWKARVSQERGPEVVRQLRRFYDLLPYVVTGKGFVACHAGPPTGTVTREKLINTHEHKRLVHQLTWGRVRSPRRAAGYTKRDVRALQKALGQAKPGVMIVSHNPGSSHDTVRLDYGGIKRHHLVYSARTDRVSAFIRADGVLLPLTYPARRVFLPTPGKADPKAKP